MSFVLTLIAAVLYAFGWCAGKVSLVSSWLWSALAVGWDDARTPRAPAAPVEAR